MVGWRELEVLLWDPVEVSREYISVGGAHSPLPASQHLGQLQAQWDGVKIYCGTLVFREKSTIHTHAVQPLPGTRDSGPLLAFQAEQ